jgi:lipopolysaccharide export LptBFGC system permease protein LptF
MAGPPQTLNLGEGLTGRLWQALVVVVVFAVTLRLASSFIAPAIGMVLWFFVIASVYLILFGRHRR